MLEEEEEGGILQGLGAEVRFDLLDQGLLLLAETVPPLRVTRAAVGPQADFVEVTMLLSGIAGIQNQPVPTSLKVEPTELRIEVLPELSPRLVPNAEALFSLYVGAMLIRERDDRIIDVRRGLHP